MTAGNRTNWAWFLAVSLLAPILVATPAGAQNPPATVDVVQTVETSAFSPPSPDPTGLAYVESEGRFLISDAEVEEMAIFQGVNVFLYSPTGGFQGGRSSLGFTREPEGLAYDRVGERLFVADDNADRIFELRAGPDGLFATSDDGVSSFRTSPLGAGDVEGVAVDARSATLFFVDDVGKTVYRMTPGANGFFDGLPADGGDDRVESFSLSGLAITNPEGLAFHDQHGTLLIGDGQSTRIWEVDVLGNVVRFIDISGTGVAPSGLTMGPSSTGGPDRLWVVDRGVDNDFDPNENDGQLFELAIQPGSPANLPPDAYAGPDRILFLDGQLVGEVSDDSSAPPSSSWSVLGGPGSVSLANPASATTDVTFSQPGFYELRLTAGDGTFADLDDVAIEAIRRFVDILDSQFRAEIEWVALAGITRGCNAARDRFCPTDPVSRAQMASFLVRAGGLNAGAGSNLFVDDDDSVHEDDIDRLGTAGITRGCNTAGDRFCPADNVTRGQMAAFLTRALNLPPASQDHFTDDAGSIFEDDINRLAASGITKGCTAAGDKFCPTDPVSRGQMAAFLFRAYAP